MIAKICERCGIDSLQDKEADIDKQTVRTRANGDADDGTYSGSIEACSKCRKEITNIIIGCFTPAKWKGFKR